MSNSKVADALSKLSKFKKKNTVPAQSAPAESAPVELAPVLSSGPNLVFGYDTETTGLITEYSTPSDDPIHPHLVQLAAVLVNSDTGETVDSMNVIIKPDGWEIPQVTIDIHGITMEKAEAEGIPEQEAVEMFIKMRGNALRVAYNSNFDKRIMRIATKRYLSEAESDKWHIKEDHVCSMQMARKDMKVKSVKLVDAYKHYMGKPMIGNHDAMADTSACLDVYFAILHKNAAA